MGPRALATSAITSWLAAAVLAAATTGIALAGCTAFLPLDQRLDAGSDVIGGGNDVPFDQDGPAGDVPVGSEGPRGDGADGTGEGDGNFVDTLLPCQQTPTSCGMPGACSDCTRISSPGPRCVVVGGIASNFQCGCGTSSDCPVGMACDPVTAACSTACHGNLLCNGGCCDGTNCISGAQLNPMFCGDDGGQCRSCLAASVGTACVTTATGGTCGCTGATDCTGGSSCLADSQICSTTCSDQSPCNGGCCANGVCQPGNANNACGQSGSCVDCTTGAQAGTTCIPGGVCGCSQASDCPSGQACNLATGQCSTACGGGYTDCNGGCCDGSSCNAGTADIACGSSGTCAVCGGSQPKCQASTRTCGCSAATDCPLHQACDTSTGTCGTACAGPSQTECHGGCCNDSLTPAVCAFGTGRAACGIDGFSCQQCCVGESCQAGNCVCTTSPCTL